MRFGVTLVRHLFGIVHSMILLGCLTFLTFQQIGHGTRLLFDALLQTEADAAVTHSWDSSTSGQGGESLSCDRDIGTCEALLPDRRVLIPTFRNARPRSQHLPIRIFHADTHPVIIRTRAIFCAFSCLRCVLHPHFRLLDNNTTVLC